MALTPHMTLPFSHATLCATNSVACQPYSPHACTAHCGTAQQSTVHTASPSDKRGWRWEGSFLLFASSTSSCCPCLAALASFAALGCRLGCSCFGFPVHLPPAPSSTRSNVNCSASNRSTQGPLYRPGAPRSPRSSCVEVDEFYNVYSGDCFELEVPMSRFGYFCYCYCYMVQDLA